MHTCSLLARYKVCRSTRCGIRQSTDLTQDGCCVAGVACRLPRAPLSLHAPFQCFHHYAASALAVARLMLRSERVLISLFVVLNIHTKLLLSFSLLSAITLSLSLSLSSRARARVTAMHAGCGIQLVRFH